MDDLDLDYLKEWIGKTERSSDFISEGPAIQLAMTLDRKKVEFKTGDILPPLWHWIYFLPRLRLSELKSDGHGKLGQFLPPVKLPSRMWAGGKFEFLSDFQIGEEAEKCSVIKEVVPKKGRSGNLVFVEVEHTIKGSMGGKLIETQNIVYRDLQDKGKQVSSKNPVTNIPQWKTEIVPNSMLLFRYSALTFNTHRIHYDRKYCMEEEGYEGLLVHAPLLATLLIEKAIIENPGLRFQSFQFQAHSPVFDEKPFFVCGSKEKKKLDLWVLKSDGTVGMSAVASVKSRGQSFDS